MEIQKVKVENLTDLFPGMETGKTLRSSSSLVGWNMERDDAPILRAIIRWMKPFRHLEFGTWKGFGTCLVLDNSPSTVWTLNLWQGEHYPTGLPAYSENQPVTPRRGFWRNWWGPRQEPLLRNVQTDARENIGLLIHQKNLGHRVNHVFCDSTQWDTSAYPNGFFDTIFIDGGHQTEVVASDTKKALPLLREGGVVLWHDFCLDEQVRQKFMHVETVIRGVESVAEEIHRHGIRLYWINPSWLLCGIKGNAPVPTAKG